MNPLFKFLGVLLFTIGTVAVEEANSQVPEGYSYKPSINIDSNKVISEIQFNGYTDYWHDNYNKWIRYGSLFKIAIPDLSKTIIQSKKLMGYVCPSLKKGAQKLKNGMKTSRINENRRLSTPKCVKN